MFLHPRNTVLSAHHDGELSSASAAQVEDHLKLCQSCLAKYEKLSNAANSVRHLRTMRAPSYLASKVREQIDAVERGMVPVLRGEIQRSRGQSGFFATFGLGTMATVLLVGLVLTLDYRYGEEAARHITSAWIRSSLPEPVLLLETMSSPRFLDGSFSGTAFAEVGNGQAGTLLTMASVDQYGTLRGLEVIYRSGDEEMLTRALEAVRGSGFEPARLGDRTISVNFLYFFTTTEVRPNGPRLSTLPSWVPAHLTRIRA
jgi:predicted anti-sigma-YlaC factor YlaD